MEELDIQISGRVQGVYYRTAVANIANNLNLTGYITSNEDGTISILAQGNKENLEEFLNFQLSQCCY